MNEIMLKSMVSHHEWIHGRFQISDEYAKGALSNVFDYLEKTYGLVTNLFGLSFSLANNPPIICAWIDFQEVIPESIMMRIEKTMGEFGFQCSSWWQRDLDVTRLSIWNSIPENIVEYLLTLEEEWEESRKQPNAK